VLAAADAYSYLHLLLVSGIIVSAIGLKAAVGHVAEPPAFGVPSCRSAANRPSSTPVAARHGGAVGQVAIGGSPRGWSISRPRPLPSIGGTAGSLPVATMIRSVWSTWSPAGTRPGPSILASFLTMVAPRCGPG
jgi:hypothetical protein